MTDDTSLEDFEKILEDLGLDSSESEADDDGEELTKEEIADEFDVLFAKTPTSETQHLVPSGEERTLCGNSLTENYRISEDPGPFDPVCKSCYNTLTGSGTSNSVTYNDLRNWLADEIDGVAEPSTPDSSEALRKDEAAAIVAHIKELKQERQ